jgi:hypothetical protein
MLIATGGMRAMLARFWSARIDRRHGSLLPIGPRIGTDRAALRARHARSKRWIAHIDDGGVIAELTAAENGQRAHSVRPSLAPLTAASARLRTPSLLNAPARCTLTVPSLMFNSRAIILFENPATTRGRTFACWGLRIFSVSMVGSCYEERKKK